MTDTEETFSDYDEEEEENSDDDGEECELVTRQANLPAGELRRSTRERKPPDRLEEWTV